MKVYLLFLLSWQAWANCSLPYQDSGIIQLKNWSELENSLNEILVINKYNKKKLAFTTDSRKSLVEITESSLPLTRVHFFERNLSSSEYIYWKSLIRKEDNQTVVTVFEINNNKVSKKLKSFIIKKPESDRYIHKYYRKEFYRENKSATLEMYESEMKEAIIEYGRVNPDRGFKTLYEPPISILAMRNFYDWHSKSIKETLESTKDKRVLGLALDSIAGSFITFEGYSHGVENINGVDYLVIYIEREIFRFSLINVLSLKTTVY